MTVLQNKTPFSGEMLPAQGTDGRFTLVVVVKATYLADAQGRVHLAEAQDGVYTEDEHVGEPASSSLAKASDLALFKSATEIGLVGSAYAPDGRKTVRMHIEVAVGPVRKQAAVFGNRVWRNRLGLVTVSDAEPFSTMPLVYERCFGGSDAGRTEERNPAGAGFCVERPQDGTPLPNIENPAQLIARWNDRPMPHGFGFVPGHWSPRKSFIGTYDKAWQEEQFPLPPRDFHPDYFLAAPADLRAAPYLHGDEAVEVLGASPSGPWRFSLPAVGLALSVRYRNGGPKRRLAVLDTVTLFPDLGKFTLVWRHAIACPRKILDVAEVTVFPLRLSTLRRLTNAYT